MNKSHINALVFYFTSPTTSCRVEKIINTEFLV